MTQGRTSATSVGDVVGRTFSNEKAYEVAQSIQPVFNNPHEPSSHSWAWPWQSSTDAPYGSETPPPLAPGVLPEVEPGDFLKYLQNIAERYKKFQHVRAAAQAARDQESKQGEGLLSAMQQVPAVFFQEDFMLERPATYKQVNPVDTEEGRMDKVEELTSYMDIIETNLLKEIGVRSNSFFEATGLIQDLEAVIRLASAQILELREHVVELDGAMLQTAVQVQELHRRRTNLVAVVEKLKVVERVMNAQDALHLLLPQGDFTAVLDVLEELHAIQAAEQLSGLAAFRHLESEIHEVKATLGDLMATEFLQSASFTRLDDLVASAVMDAIPGEHGQEGQGLLEPESSSGLPEDVHMLVLGLVRLGQLGPILGSFQDTCSLETKRGIRMVVDRLVPKLLKEQEHGAQLSLEEGSGIQRRLQALSPDNFLRVLKSVFFVVLGCLRHVEAVRDSVAAGLEFAKILRSRQAGILRECSEALQASAEAAHGRWAKLLSARLPVIGTLSIEHLRSLVQQTEELRVATAQHSTRGAAGLRGLLQQQSKEFLEGMHAANLAKLSVLLDSETWVATPPETVHCDILRRFVEVKDQAEAAAEDGAGSKSASSEEKRPEALAIGGRRFCLVPTALEMLEMLEGYCDFMATAPGFGNEVAHRVVELIKVFNARSCHLVLGAGAMQVAGLKSITAKHLALSCQCLGFFIALQPSVLHVFSVELESHRKALLAPEMGRLLQDLAVHRDEIYAKLVTIMRERLLAGARQLHQSAEKWGEGKAKPNPTAFAEATAKQLRVLRGVLLPLMNKDDLAVVFGRISGLFGTTLAESYGRLQPPDEDAGAWEAQRRADTILLLQVLQELPVQRKELQENLRPLAAFCKRYGSLPEPADTPTRRRSAGKSTDGSQTAQADPVQGLEEAQGLDIAATVTAAGQGEALVMPPAPPAPRSEGDPAASAEVHLEVHGSSSWGPSTSDNPSTVPQPSIVEGGDRVVGAHGQQVKAEPQQTPEVNISVRCRGTDLRHGQ